MITLAAFALGALVAAIQDWRQWAGPEAPTNNAPLREGKARIYEGGQRVPLMIRWPGKIAPRCDDLLMSVPDIYPTLIDLCGLPANPKLEGVSLQPLLENTNADWKHVAISTLGQNNHAVRDERWRYIRYADGSEELYDHQTDPNEWKNLVSESPMHSHVEVIARLKKHLPKTNAPQRGNEPKK